MTSGGNILNYFPEDQLTEFSARVSTAIWRYHHHHHHQLACHSEHFFPVAFLREILVTRRVSGR